MKKIISKTKKKVSPRAWLWILVICVVFALVSLGFILAEAFDGGSQISGRVVEVRVESVVIENRRGERTVLLIDEFTDIGDDRGRISEGVLVHSFGERVSNDEFRSRGIRVVERR